MNSINFLPFVLPLLIAGIGSLYALPRMIRYSIARNWYDQPGGRKTHTKPIPRTGGMAFIPLIALSILLAGWWQQELLSIGMWMGLVILYVTGVVDDLKGLRAGKKLVFQVLAAFALTMDGTRIVYLEGIGNLSLFWQYFVTVGLVVVLVNAYNLLDGIDGLAAGLAVFSSLIFMYVFWQRGDVGGCILAGATTGAYGAFLRYNFAPAKVFMGDAGSLGLGYLLAVMGLRSLHPSLEGELEFQVWQVLAIWSIALHDVLRVMAERGRKHGRIFKADRNHIHHKVLESGFSPPTAVGLIVLANGIAVGVALFLPHLEWYYALPALSLYFLLSIAIFRNLSWVNIRKEVRSLRQKRTLFKSDNPFFNRSFPSDPS